MIRNQLMRAITYATTKHQSQERKVDKTPFISHPYRVAMLLKDHQLSDDLVIAGLLHDVVEDTDGTIEEIEHLFGENVAKLVGYVTESDKSMDWEARKEQSIEKLKTAPYDVKLLTCADKIDNLQSMIDAEMIHGSAMWNSFVGTRDQQVWYYQSMYDSICSDLDDKDWHGLIYLFKALLDTFIEG